MKWKLIWFRIYLQTSHSVRLEQNVKHSRSNISQIFSAKRNSGWIHERISWIHHDRSIVAKMGIGRYHVGVVGWRMIHVVGSHVKGNSFPFHMRIWRVRITHYRNMPSWTSSCSPRVR